MDWIPKTQHRVLYVEECDEVRALVIKLLTRAGFFCQGAAHAQKALAMCASCEAFDAVMTCHDMRGMNGLQLIKRLRADGCRARMIVHASPFDHETKAAYGALGVDAFIWKPDDVNTIVSTVTALCAKR